jgi:hypothetical protein
LTGKAVLNAMEDNGLVKLNRDKDGKPIGRIVELAAQVGAVAPEAQVGKNVHKSISAATTPAAEVSNPVLHGRREPDAEPHEDE